MKAIVVREGEMWRRESGGEVEIKLTRLPPDEEGTHRRQE
jgi:hypothetical protein